MNILAIDTATEACSVALASADDIHARWEQAPRGHGERVFPLIEEVLAEAQIARSTIDLLAFGRGPGAFTGVRIATGLVQGLASGLDRPVVPISTLATLAQGIYRQTGHERVLAALDARMSEVYWGAYYIGTGGLMALQGEECVAPPDAVPVPGGTGWAGGGTGWSSYAEQLAARAGEHLSVDLGHVLPHARDMIPHAAQTYQAGHAVTAEQALPVYLRDRVASPPR